MRNSQYTREFRDSTVQLVMNSDQSALQIARDLNVNSKTIYNWIREYNLLVTTSKSVAKESVEEENRRLRAENKILKQERDILKKATAYFAKEVL